MNKTFKIVFNKARGALMVANELTGSVQKKGVRVVLASSIIALATMTANASSAYEWGTQIPIIGETTFTVDGNTDIGAKSDTYSGIHVTPEASGRLDNLTLEISAIGPKNGSSQDFQIIGFDNNNNTQANDIGSPNTELGGDSLKISIKTDFVGGGNNQAAAILSNQDGKISAENVSLNVASSAKNGKSVYGIEAGQGTLTISSRNIDITLNTATDRGASSYSEANGIDVFGNSTVDASAISSLVIKGTSSGKTATTNGVNGGSSITGIVFEGGTGNFGGTTQIELSAVGGNATGVKATNYFYNSTMGENWGDATVSSELATAAAVGVAYNGAKDNTVLLAVKGDSNLIAKTNTGKAYGVNLSGKTTAEILGNIAIDVSASGEKGVAYGVNVSEGNVKLGSLGTTLKINAKAADAEAIDIVKGGTVSVGDASNKLSDVSLNTNGSTFTAYLSESNLNVYSNNYSQTGSGHGLYVTHGSSLTMDVDSFDSTTDYTAIHTRDSEKSVANVTAKTFKATATGDDTGVALLQFNEGSTINVTADDVSLTGTKKLGGGVLGTGTWGTVNLTANNSMVLNGNINGVYGGVNNTGKTAAFNINAKTLSLNGDINVGSLNEPKDSSTKTDGAISNFSRNTNVSVVAEKAEITGNINVWGNASGNDKDVGKLDNSNDSNIVNLDLGDGSVISGDISIVGQGQTNHVAITATGSNKDLTFNGNISATNQGSIILNGGTYNVGSLTLSDASLLLDSGTLAANSFDFTSGSLQVENGTFAIGTSIASAQAAMAKMTGLDATSILFVGKSVALGEGNIVVGTDTSALVATYDNTTSVATASVNISSDGALIVDQTAVGDNPVFTDASVTFNGGQLGIANAAPNSTLTLSETVEGNPDSVVTDNPFIKGTYSASDGVLTTTLDSENGLGALASTGIQAMTRRADTILAQTIADRTSVDQELAAGTNLWVDVTAERYEADKLDNGGEFKSDMGYGAFGADFAVTQDITAGAAFQYGKGSLRSGVSSIKNSIDSYGVTAYGAMKFGDSKVVAEASYIKNENDITSSQTALNQSVDSEIYSVGVRGQHRFTAGNFQFVPSVGVRVSRLNTDAMQVGAVNIKKQEQTLVQVPIALRVNGFEQNVSGWSVAPSFKIAYVPTFGDKEISVFGADQTVIDTSPVQGDFGIRAQNGNLMVNANMMLGGGKDGTSSVGGKVGLKYVF